MVHAPTVSPAVAGPSSGLVLYASPPHRTDVPFAGWRIRQNEGVVASVPAVVERTGTVVRYVQVKDELSQIQVAWPALEAAVGSLKGRRFIAAFDPLQGWYRACVQIQSDVTTAESSLPEMVIPGGRFVRIRLRGEPPGVYGEIAAAYQTLESSAQRDDSRLSLEHYRRFDEIDVLMPVT